MVDYSQFKEIKVTFSSPGVLHVQFNKPKKLNAVNEATWSCYGAAFRAAGADPEVRSIVVSGEGKGFCAGIDLNDLAGLSNEKEFSRRAIDTYQNIRRFQENIRAPFEINKPVIGAVHGVAYGLGIDILSQFDIRYAAKNSRFSVREIVVGMAPDIGTLQQMPRIVGNHSWLREVVYTGREFLADEALLQGFVSRVFETQEETVAAALELAKEIAGYSPVATHGIKKSLNYANDHSLEDGLRQIAEYNSYALETDLLVGVTAAMRKKKAIYPNL